MNVSKNFPVAIFIGSSSDVEKIKPATDCLKEFNIDYLSYIISAHRTPETLAEKLKTLAHHEVQVIIAGAGMAAHLAGVIASKTLLPVIGVPLSGSLLGLDALLSMVQMPKQVPVATVAIDGALNAALLAVQILALKDENLATKLLKYRETLTEKLTLPNQGQVF